MFRKFFFISFFIFLLIQTVFIAIISYKNYKTYLSQYELSIRNKLELASYTLSDYNITFVKKTKKPFVLYKEKEIYMLFPIPLSKEYYMKIIYPWDKYIQDIKNLQKRVLLEFVFYFFIIFFFSIFFTLLLVMPIKKAYEINKIFIKDILHDFNTPISSLKINLFLLKKNFDLKYIENISLAISSILNLQKNLRAYIQKPHIKKEKVNLKEVIEERVLFYKKLYPNKKVIYHLKDKIIETDPFAFERIVDNLLSNAFKYTKNNGLIHIDYKLNYIAIKNSSIIKNPKLVFNKFYKESQRGLGIGLYIVKTLSKLLNLKIYLRSKKHTIFFIKLSILFMTTLNAINIDKEISKIFTLPSEKRYKALNNLKIQILKLKEKERLKILKKLLKYYHIYQKPIN